MSKEVEQTALEAVAEGVPEAPGSMNIRFASSLGFEYMLTVRSFKEQGAGTDLLGMIPAIETKLGTLDCKPIFGRNSTKAAPQQDVAPGEDPAEKACPIHDVMMKRRTNAGGSWYSHKLADDSWCTGKEKKK